jgi:integrase
MASGWMADIVGSLRRLVDAPAKGTRSCHSGAAKANMTAARKANTRTTDMPATEPARSMTTTAAASCGRSRGSGPHRGGRGLTDRRTRRSGILGDVAPRRRQAVGFPDRGTHRGRLRDQRQVFDITIDVKKVLQGIWHLREMSRDTRQKISAIFKAAIAENLRPVSLGNPADWETRLKPIMAKQKKRGQVRGHHKALPYAELPGLMRELADTDMQSARALEVTILTLVRTIETINMKWTQLDLDAGIWNLSFDDTKNDREKQTPLPKQVLAYLREAHETRICDYVFPGRDLKSPISNNTMLKNLKEITGDDSLTVHGFRTTFRSWVQDEETGIDRETAEHCMHHILGDESERAYKSGQALKKRRAAMQKFADFATRPPATVTPLRRVA